MTLLRVNLRLDSSDSDGQTGMHLWLDSPMFYLFVYVLSVKPASNVHKSTNSTTSLQNTYSCLFKT